MNRRHFLKQAGLGTSILGTVGSLVGAGELLRKRNPFTGEPRPEDWVLKRHNEMHGLLSKGWRTSWLTGYTQPCLQHGWQLVGRVPLDLRFAMRQILPLPGSLISIDELTYAWTEKRTAVGPVRVDFLQSRMTEILKTRMLLFDIELDAIPLGTIGYFEGEPGHLQRKADPLHTNRYCGVRTGDLAFKIENSKGFGDTAWRNAGLATWSKKNADKLVPGVSA